MRDHRVRTGPSRRALITAGLAMTAGVVTACADRPEQPPVVVRRSGRATTLPLPAPRTSGGPGLLDALTSRRSVREFGAGGLRLDEVGQLLWAAQGVTASWGGRTAPSAGALYPLELYVSLPDRVLRYRPVGHRAQVWADGDARLPLADAAASRDTVAGGAVVFVVAAVLARTSGKYGARAGRYVDLETGHATQNLLLQAVALDLGAVPVGAFDEQRVARQLLLPAGVTPRYLVPVGRRRVT